jgi:hypothetical protein
MLVFEVIWVDIFVAKTRIYAIHQENDKN